MTRLRSIEVLVPEGGLEAVVDALEARAIDYAVVDETSSRDFDAVVAFAVPKDEVESVLDEFREVGVEEDGYAIVNAPEAVVSERYERRIAAKERAKAEEEAKEDEEGTEARTEVEDDTSDDEERIARDELRTTAADMSRSSRNFLLFSVISAIVAAAGLMTDSAAVVVGSMVIAPLIGPAMASSVGSVINDDELFLEGVKSQFLGLFVAGVSATAFAVLARFLVAPEVDFRLFAQVAERINPGVLSLVVALGAGIAGALALTSGVSAALVGVMIAAALIPPVATAGLGVAYLDVPMWFSASVLVVVNMLSINLASLATLWLKGYRPENWYEERAARRRTQKRVALLVVVVLALSSMLVYSEVDTRQNRAFEDAVQDVVVDELGDASVTVEYETQVFHREPVRVVVTTSTDRRGVADLLAGRIAERTGHELPVEVVYREVERAPTPPEQS